MDTRETTVAGAPTDDRGRVETDETRNLIASDKVEGTPVYNPAGERLGSVYNFMVDKKSGKVAYAVMSFGGFLGIGREYHPLPWDVLDYDPRQGGYVVHMDADKLRGAPTYDMDSPPWGDPAYGRRVYDYYGIAYPYV
ncbi:photosystem reaction center subunit H [Allostella sp. ATCC 35155]|nr:photosystem reaction center subunit H [Stella sp. ATCC 35155]